MKKGWEFLRSMRFGMLLLCLILLCSLPGSLIQQESSAAFYLENYSWGELLLTLQFDHIFSSWYFVGLLALLCLNLSLCSVIRVRSTRKLHSASERRMENVQLKAVDPQKANTLEKLMRSRGLRLAKEEAGRRIYKKGVTGFYGSFVTHFALLLTLLFAAAGSAPEADASPPLPPYFIYATIALSNILEICS